MSSPRNTNHAKHWPFLALLLLAGPGATGCSGADSANGTWAHGHIESATPPSSQGGLAANGTGWSAGSTAVPPSDKSSTRAVEETDLYRLEGDRLYYLNGSRGLVIFDVADVDHPKLLGRSPVFGSPVEMRVKHGVATVVLADWYGNMDDGAPFHGSIVRGIDASDPSDIKILGEAKLGGSVRDTRVVREVLYAVSEEYGPCGSQAKTVISSVSFGNNKIVAKGRFETPGYGGIFNVTPSAIMFAHDVTPSGTDPISCNQDDRVALSTALEYVDISDPGGEIKVRGHLEFEGRVQGWGADNGRWNLDFADGRIARVFACDGASCGGSEGNYVLITADFSNPDAPVVASRLSIPGLGWTPTARFDKARMYLSPSDAGYYSYGYGAGGARAGDGAPKTPVRIYDLSDPVAPKLAGSTEMTGSVWLLVPSGDRLFALGNDAYGTSTGISGNEISLRYLDVSDPSHPALLGTSTFGAGLAWTPAAGTVKAFTKDDREGLVVLPFRKWNAKVDRYDNGLQLIEFTPTSLRTAGAAETKGWVDRGAFVKNRLVSLSDVALSIVDYTHRDNPVVIAEPP